MAVQWCRMVGVSATEGFGPARRSAALPSFSMAAAVPGLTPEQIKRDRRGASLASLQRDRRRSGAARGARLTLIRDGEPVEVLDAMSSWWTAIHGHGHPDLDAAMAAQLATMNHVMFGGLTHEPAARLAQLLVDIAPSGLETVFVCDSGSVSVEVAVKMALQYWRSRGHLMSGMSGNIPAAGTGETMTRPHPNWGFGESGNGRI
jgi:adenosylmethionine---8-amino-7-oxononanoate aminotransferase